MSYNATLNTADAFAVTPSDSTAICCHGFYVGGTGNVKVTTAKGTAVTFTAVPVGAIIRLSCSLIWATGTTATNIVAFGPT
jgi:hypothetical protein